MSMLLHGRGREGQESSKSCLRSLCMAPKNTVEIHVVHFINLLVNAGNWN